MDVKLVVQKNGASGQEVSLRGPETIVGRQKGSGVRIPSAMVSRQHCQLTWEDELLRVEDLSSANGTFVNGRRIGNRTILRPGDKLRVGPTTFIVHYQLTQAAIDQLLKEDEQGEEVVAFADVEVVDDSLAQVELVLDDQEELTPLNVDGPTPEPGANPLEALREIEEAATSAPPPKKGGPPPVKKPKPPPPRRPAPPAHDDVELVEDGTPPPPRRVKLSKIQPAASDDEPIAISPAEDDVPAGAPDVSMIMGHKNWEAPAGQDIRDILSQLEKGKKA